MSDSRADEGRGPAAGAPPLVGLDGIIDFGQGVFDRVADRAKGDLQLARERRYGLGAWLDDVQWFWSEVADDATQVVEGLRRQQSRPDSAT